MNFYFVSYYTPRGKTNKFLGLMDLCYNNGHYLRWIYGNKNIEDFSPYLDRYVKDNLYFIEEVLRGEDYSDGFPFKPEYFNCVMSKEELREHLLCGQV